MSPSTMGMLTTLYIFQLDPDLCIGRDQILKSLLRALHGVEVTPEMLPCCSATELSPASAPKHPQQIGTTLRPLRTEPPPAARLEAPLAMLMLYTMLIELTLS